MSTFEKIHIFATDLSFSDYYYLDLTESASEVKDFEEFSKDTWVQVDSALKDPSNLAQMGFKKTLIFIQKTPQFQPVSGVLPIHDVSEIRELLLEQQRYHYDLDPEYFADPEHFNVENYSEEIKEKMNLGEAALFGIREDDRWIGFAVVEKDMDSAYLLELLITASARGKGYGKILLVACENWAVGQNLNHLWTTASADNASALSFYERTGFSPYKERWSRRI